MTDQTMPADPVREIVKKMHHHANQEHVRRDAEQYFRFFAKQLDDLLPPPPRPMLADMTDEERRECRRMQCDVKGEASTVVIIQVFIRQETARLMWPNGWTEVRRFDEVTPRPDLPRLEWPGDKKVEDLLPVRVGDVIESADDPAYPRSRTAAC